MDWMKITPPNIYSKFTKPLQAVFQLDTTLAAANDRKLDDSFIDQSEGYLILSKQPSWVKASLSRVL